MCDNEKDREISKKIFMTAKTVAEFMEIWGKFYENKICTPTYLAKFIGGPDNPQATKELGQKLKEIARRGFLAIDSQVTIPGSQKGYIIGFLPNEMASIVAQNLNRYSGIVAFYNNLFDFRKKNIDVSEELYVTYDSLQEEVLESAKIGKMLGEPFTSVGGTDISSFEDIRGWMSPPVKKKMSPDKYKYFVAVTPCFDSPPHLVFDKLLEVLSEI